MKISTDRKAFLIGSGFDKLFGLPTWNELIESFKDHLYKYFKYSISIQNNLKNIYKQENIALNRKLEMLFVFAEKNGFTKKQFNNFLKIKLNTNFYNENEIMKMKIFNKISSSEDVFITTNISNTFKEMGWEYQFYHNENESSLKTYFPVHGNLFIKKIKNNDENNKLLNTVILESDYLNPKYGIKLKKMNDILNNVKLKEVHICGYSMNDIDILRKIMNSKNIKKIILYFECKENNLYKKIYFKDLFKKNDKEIKFIFSDDNSDNLLKIKKEFNEENKYIIMWEKFAEVTLKSLKIMDFDDLNNVIYDWNNIIYDEKTNKNIFKGVIELKSVNPARIYGLINAFIKYLEKKSKIKDITIFINDIILCLEIKNNTQLMIALENIIQNYSKYIKNEKLKNVVLKNLKYFYEYNSNLSIIQTIRYLNDIEVYKKYLNYSNNINILSQNYKMPKNLKWVNVLTELFKDYKFLQKVLILFSKDKSQAIYIKEWRGGYCVTTYNRRQLFVSMLSTIKNNFNEFKDINFDDVEKKYNFYFNEAEETEINDFEEIKVYDVDDINADFLKLIKLIKLKKENKIPKIKKIKLSDLDNDSISWYADEYEKILNNKNIKNIKKLNNFMKENLYITKNSKFEKRFDSMPKAVSLTKEEQIQRIKNAFKNKTVDQIVKELLTGKRKYKYRISIDDYLNYLIPKKFSIKKFSKEMLNNNNRNFYQNYGDILFSLHRIDSKISFNIFEKSKSKFLSSQLIELFAKNYFNEKNINQLINSFNEQKYKFKENYSSSELMKSWDGTFQKPFQGTFEATFEGKFFLQIISIYIKNGKYETEKVLKILEKLKITNKSFLEVINVYRFMLGDKKIKISNLNFLFEIIQKYHYGFNKNIWEDDCIELFTKYIKKIIKRNEKFIFQGYLNEMIQKLECKKMLKIFNVIDKKIHLFCNDNYNVGYIFLKKFNLIKSPCFKKFKKTKYFKYELLNFFEDFKGERKYKESLYEVKYIVDFMKEEKNYNIKPYHFHWALYFCKYFSFNVEEIKHVLERLEKTDQDQMMKEIKEPDPKLNMFEFLKEKLNSQDIELFVNKLQDLDIPIPEELNPIEEELNDLKKDH